jgi:hypothetical protein
VAIDDDQLRQQEQLSERSIVIGTWETNTKAPNPTRRMEKKTEAKRTKPSGRKRTTEIQDQKANIEDDR